MACVGPLRPAAAVGAAPLSCGASLGRPEAKNIFHVAYWLPREMNMAADAGSMLESLEAVQEYCRVHSYTLVL